MGKAGPDPIKINWDEFDKLVSYQCTQEEIAAFFGISVDTLDRACVRDRGEKLAEVWTKRKALGRVRLRKAQFAIVEGRGPGAATLAIYLDKKMFPEERIDVPHDPAPPPPHATPTKLSFSDFCVNAGYPRPFPMQEEMRAFVLDEELTRILLGARGYGKTDYTTVLGTAYAVYCDWFDWAQGKIPALTETTLIISKSKTRNTAMIGEIANALAKAGVPLETENASCIRVQGLIGKDDSVEAIPLKASFRGRHPKRIIMDDPVTEEDTSEAMRTLVKKKYDEAYKLSKNIAIIGQPAHQFDLYADLREILLKKEVPHGTIPELDADLVAMRNAGIDQTSIEMSYHLRVPKTGAMPFSDIKFVDQLPEGRTAAFLDPSEGGDYSALSIFRGYGQGIAVKGYAVKRAWYHWTELVDLLVAASVTDLAFETNKHGEQPIEQLTTLLAPHGIRVVGINSTMPKVTVIESAAAISHMIHLSRDSDPTYTKQVTRYEYKAKYDDAPDSLARGLLWLGLIREKK